MENTATVSLILSMTATLPKTLDELIGTVTGNYLAGIDPQHPPSPADIQYGIFSDVDAAVDLDNAMRAKNNQWPHLRGLTSAQIADVLLYLYPIANIAYCGINADPEYDVLTMYQKTGKDQGPYSSDIKTLRNLIRQYCYNLADNGVLEVLKLLRDKAPRLVRNTDRNLVPVNNGIFDFDKKVLMPFDPDLVFVSKSKINYVDAPSNPVIHNPDNGTDWDVES